MLFQQPQARADDFGFIVEAAAGNKTVNQSFEMLRYGPAHIAGTFNSLKLLSKIWLSDVSVVCLEVLTLWFLCIIRD